MQNNNEIGIGSANRCTATMPFGSPGVPYSGSIINKYILSQSRAKRLAGCNSLVVGSFVSHYRLAYKGNACRFAGFLPVALH